MRYLSILSSALDLFFPRGCASCGRHLGLREEGWVCAECREKIDYIIPPFCPRCSLPYTQGAEDEDGEGHLCGKCRRGPIHFDRARSVGRYQGVLRELIHSFKYNAKVNLRGELAWMLWERLSSEELPCRYHGIVHVPIHIKRAQEREYDQSMLLAVGLAKLSGMPHLKGLLVRERPTPPQIGLRERERMRNVRGAFRVASPAAIEGKNLLLVDDVFTSGATANECARVLKRAGASGVDLLTLARAARD